MDNDASLALQEMLSGNAARSSSEMRSAWTRYILALLYRAPETVKDIKTHTSTIWQTARESIKEDYNNRRLPTDPDTFAKFEAMLDTSGVRSTNMIMRIIDNDRNGRTILNMHWSVHKLEGAQLPLLLSDHPLDWPKGLSDPNAHIALPISPRRVFLAANDPSLKDAGFWQKQTHVVKVLNKIVVGQAKEYVWGTDDKQLEFVKKHIGSIPIRPAMTAAQKAASLLVAKQGFRKNA